MNLDEFLKKLIDNDCELKNVAFKENSDEILKLVSNFNSKIAISLSSSFFNDNINIFSHIPKKTHLRSIISLPIFKDSSNLILIILNPYKTSEEFVLIDESDSLIHNDVNYLDIEENLANELVNSIKNYKDSDNALILDMNSIFENDDIQDNQSLEKDEYADFLALDDFKNMVLENKHRVISDNLFESDNELFKSIKRRVMSDDIVDELLNLKEEKSVRQEMERHNIISTGGASYDIFSSNFINEAMHIKKRENPKDMLYKNGKPLLDENVEFRKLVKIVDLQNIDEKNSNDSILIGTCKHCNSKLVFYNNEIEDFAGEIYVEITNFSDMVLKDYLYEFLNSDYGRDELLYFSKGYKYIRANLIKSIKIPIPSIETQKEIVKASREAREFFKTVDLLKREYNSNILDYKHISDSISELKGDIEFDSHNVITKLPRSWRHAYQGLIWPLAISYLSATKGGFEIVEKKDNYLKLFEFIAAFNSIILLSGLPEDIYQKNFNDIWNSPKGLNEYKKMTFGNWAFLFKNLAEVYKNNNFASKLDEELFKKITSDRIIDILFKAKDFRNEEFHESQSNVYEAKEVIEILDDYLEEIFDILDAYSNYKLIYTTGDLKATRNGYNHDVIMLNGPCAQPIYDKVSFDRPLSRESLYLYNRKNNKKLEIKDNFMKFIPLDKHKKHWVLYIYYKCDRDEFNAYYKCFQSKEEDFKQRITSFKNNILD